MHAPTSARDTSPEIEHDVLERAANIIKCLGHPLRLRLLEGLENGEMTVSDLQEYSGATQAAVSQQLATLKSRRVVDSRRDGAYVHYRIIEPKVEHILGCIRTCDTTPRPSHGNRT
ncbi:MAG: metalloregulator ArsR/SmtB family transcription factor [Gemmatimonadales bacterium]